MWRVSNTATAMLQRAEPRRSIGGKRGGAAGGGGGGVTRLGGVYGRLSDGSANRRKKNIFSI